MSIDDINTTEKKLDELTRWLSPLNCAETHNQTLQLRQEGTCMWFPQMDIFKNWRRTATRFLWVHGKAGCGKSVLAASTIEHLEKSLRKEEVVLFFYCDFRDKRSTSPAVIMRSLLSQLLRHIGNLGVDPGDLPNKMLQQKSEGTLSLDDPDKFCELIWRAASCLLYDPLIVIDGLDECTDIEVLLRAIVKLNQGDVRLLVTSRPDQVVTDHFRGLGSLSLETMIKQVAGDIASHVMRAVDSHEGLRSADPEMKEEICVTLNNKADGRFRWVQCQLETLKRCSGREALRKALDNLPNELEATYERILGEIDERKLEGELARRALAWLAVALEPLRLTQIVQCLTCDFEEGNIECQTQPLGRALIHALSSLVTHYEETDVLTFSHLSVKEYLMGNASLPTYHIIPHVAHAEITQLCVRYVSLVLKQGPFCGKVPPLQRFPTLSCILSSGFNHLAHVDPQSLVVLETLKSLGLDVRRHPSHWESLCELREEYTRWSYPPWPSSRHDFVLYILIAYSSLGLFRTFLASDHHLKPRVWTNPLVYAADLRKTEHAMELLTHGADVNVRGFVVDDLRHAFPLEIAVDLGEDELVGELLRRGCVVTPELFSTAICMPWCTTQVLVKLMQTAQFMEWACDIGDEMLYRCVFNSARPNAGDTRKADEDHVALARILCKTGQDLSADSPFGIELIERAIHAAHTSMLDFLLPSDQPPPSRFLISASTGDTSETVPVIHFLLQKGVDVNAVSDGGDTALHLAVMCPWEPRGLELTKMLVGAGCRPNACNVRGETPMVVAVKRGHRSVIEFFLSCQIPLPPDALHIALGRCLNPEMIRWLITKGANVHAISSTGDNVLHRAVMGSINEDADEDEDEDEDEDGVEDEQFYEATECLDLIMGFLEAGCNPIVRNRAGNTIFEICIEHERTSVVKFLLLHDVQLPSNILANLLERKFPVQSIQFLVHLGADIQATTSDGKTLLHLAFAEYTESDCSNSAKTFFEAGYNPAACDYDGETVFDLSMEWGYTLVLDLLLSYDIPLPTTLLMTALQRCLPYHSIQTLVHKGANVHLVMPNGNSLLHHAIATYSESDCSKLAKTSIEAGYDSASRDSGGYTVLDAAINRGYTMLVESLLSYNVPFPPDILLAIIQGQSPGPPLYMIQFLVDKGANVHFTASNGDTLLHLAIDQYLFEGTCREVVNKYIKAGCNPAACNSEGVTVLEAAVRRGHTSLVELLLSSNAPLPSDILLIAVRRRSTLEMIHFLIRRGADVHCTTANGDTVLHLSITQYHFEEVCLELVKAFIAAGCNPVASNCHGETALKAAMERGYTSVVELLLQCKFAISPDVLPNALRRQCGPHIIQLLVSHDVIVSDLNWDASLQLAHASYHGQDRQQVIDALDTARNLSYRSYSSLDDEMPTHVAKKQKIV